MTDMTTRHLDAALIDQIAAGIYGGRPYCFVAVAANEGWQLGIAVANEPGYNPIAKVFADYTEAHEWADGLNHHIGLNDNKVRSIVISTMGGMSYQP